MLRSTLVTASLTALLTLGASAQIAVNGGVASVAPPPQQVQSTAAELGIPSVPAINTPFAHVGPEALPPADQEQMQAQTPAAENQNPAATSGRLNAQAAQPFNMGVATISTNPFESGLNGTDGKSLGEIAREMKQKQQNANAKTFTNADIDKLNGTQGSGGISGAATASNTNSEWPANNGVITPGSANSQGAIAAPSSPAPSQGNSPFAPRMPENTPSNTTPIPPANAPQANAKPSASQPYEMAQNNPANAGIPQDNGQTSTAADQNAAPADQSAGNAAQSRTLPKTASRLPLLGVLGFVSISMGLFVRYQRAKEVK